MIHGERKRARSTPTPAAASSASPRAATNQILTGARTLWKPGITLTSEYSPPAGPMAYHTPATVSTRPYQRSRVDVKPTSARGTSRIPM